VKFTFKIQYFLQFSQLLFLKRKKSSRKTLKKNQFSHHNLITSSCVVIKFFNDWNNFHCWLFVVTKIISIMPMVTKMILVIKCLWWSNVILTTRIYRASNGVNFGCSKPSMSLIWALTYVDPRFTMLTLSWCDIG
jgi:hypothetical protein